MTNDDNDDTGSYVSDGAKQAGNSNNQTIEELGQLRQMAAQETRRVWILKLSVVITILVTAAAVCTGTYIILKNKEGDDYINSVRFAAL
jgi:hypothetical protein